MGKAVCITGANRGIGLGFTKEFLRRGWTVAATCRTPDEATELQALQREYGTQLLLIACDVTSGDSVREMARTVEKQLPALDIVLNNAGVLPEDDHSIGTMQEDVLLSTFDINVAGPVRVTQVLLPLVRRGTEKKIIHLSTEMASIGANRRGGSYSYRISKAALNMFMKNLALELRDEGIVSMALHPGWAQTDMGGARAPVPVDVSIRGMMGLIEKATLQESGRVFDYEGRELVF
jgi:NAD(P)-dependent dehydrogenase (short-subunit alcohol dehydrogenase family)